MHPYGQQRPHDAARPDGRILGTPIGRCQRSGLACSNAVMAGTERPDSREGVRPHRDPAAFPRLCSHRSEAGQQPATTGAAVDEQELCVAPGCVEEEHSGSALPGVVLRGRDPRVGRDSRWCLYGLPPHCLILRLPVSRTERGPSSSGLGSPLPAVSGELGAPTKCKSRWRWRARLGLSCW